MTFTPTDTTDYTTATATTTIAVAQATPTITWAAPAGIVYGTALSATQLDATSSVAGTFAYSPAAGTVLKAGSQTLSVTFTPTDTTDYTTATADDDDRGGAGDAGDHLGQPRGHHLRHGAVRDAARRDVERGGDLRLLAGRRARCRRRGADTLSVTFTPTDTTDYTTATATTTIVVAQATPAITWATPAGITYGTALSATQLDATSSVPGTFAYSPAAGHGAEGGEQTRCR